MTGTQIFAFVALPIIIGLIAWAGVALNDRAARRSAETIRRSERRAAEGR